MTDAKEMNTNNVNENVKNDRQLEHPQRFANTNILTTAASDNEKREPTRNQHTNETCTPPR